MLRSISYGVNEAPGRARSRARALTGNMGVTAAEILAGDLSTRLAHIFRALGDPTRIALLARLAERERAVGDLVSDLGLPQPAVSRHLRILREAGLVVDERRARRVVYRVRPEANAELLLVLHALTPEPAGSEATRGRATGAAGPASASVLFID